MSIHKFFLILKREFFVKPVYKALCFKSADKIINTIIINQMLWLERYRGKKKSNHADVYQV